MKKVILMLLVTLFFSLATRAQYEGCSSRPADSYSDGKAVAALPAEILKAFPKAQSISKQEKWTEVYDGSRRLMGYAVYSKPASDGITGYAGETPLLIAFDKEMKVLSVQLLANEESHFIVDKVLQSPLLATWNGLTAKDARKKRVDAVTGATYTSNSIIESFRAAMKRIAK